MTEWKIHGESIMIPAIVARLFKILFEIGITSSKSEAIRMIKQGAVDIIRPNTDTRERQLWKGKQEISLITNNTIIQVGHKFIRLKVTPENCNAFIEVLELHDIPEELEKLLKEIGKVDVNGKGDEYSYETAGDGRLVRVSGKNDN